MFTLLHVIFSRPFELSLAPIFCSWVSEDDSSTVPGCKYLKTRRKTAIAKKDVKRYVSSCPTTREGLGSEIAFSVRKWILHPARLSAIEQELGEVEPRKRSLSLLS